MLIDPEGKQKPLEVSAYRYKVPPPSPRHISPLTPGIMIVLCIGLSLLLVAMLDGIAHHERWPTWVMLAAIGGPAAALIVFGLSYLASNGDRRQACDPQIDADGTYSINVRLSFGFQRSTGRLTLGENGMGFTSEEFTMRLGREQFGDKLKAMEMEQHGWKLNLPKRFPTTMIYIRPLMKGCTLRAKNEYLKQLDGWAAKDTRPPSVLLPPLALPDAYFRPTSSLRVGEFGGVLLVCGMITLYFFAWTPLFPITILLWIMAVLALAGAAGLAYYNAWAPREMKRVRETYMAPLVLPETRSSQHRPVI